MGTVIGTSYLLCAESLCRAWLFGNLWIAACQAPLCMGFFRQKYWSGLPFLPQGIFLTQGLNLCLLCLLHCWQIIYPLSHWESPVFSQRDWYENWVYTCKALRTVPARVLATGRFVLLCSSGEPFISGVKPLLKTLQDEMWISDTGLLICTRRKIVQVLTPHMKVKKYIWRLERYLLHPKRSVSGGIGGFA